MPDTATWVGLAILIADITIVVGFSVRVLLQRRPVGATFAWLTILLVVPFAGAVLYLAIGERRLGGRRARVAEQIVLAAEEWLADLRERFDGARGSLAEAHRPLERQATNVVGIPALPGNQLVLESDSVAVLRGLAADIDAARRTVLLEFYLWHDGGAADLVAEAVIRAAERGVHCRVLLDDVGSAPFLRGAWVKRMRSAGAEVVAALPVNFFRALFRRIDLRNHRKLALIDDEIAWTGSQNLVDPAWFKQSADVGRWIDAAVRVRGPTVEALTAAFAADWEMETAKGREILDESVAALPDAAPGAAMVQVVPSGPGYAPEALHEILLTTIYTAREELILTTPYFVPDEAMLAALVSAAHRGVDVTVVVPARVDSLMVRNASHAHYDELLAAGVQLFEFTDGLLHSKTITVDCTLSLIGSTNLDMRSLWLNFELTLLVYDAAFTDQLRAMQLEYSRRSTQIDLDDWRQRPARKRLVESVFKLVGPLL